MATPLNEQQFRNIAKRLVAHGISVRFYPGWETRGRPYTWGPTYGFVWHHTGSDGQSDDYLKFLFVDGRPGIPGPLCQFAIRANGEVWIGASGRANHAGGGSSRTLGHVRNEDYNGYSSELSPGSDDIDGNAVYLGVEIMYAGTHGMTETQYHSAIHLAAEVNREFGSSWTALSNIGHREHSGRKWDPGSHKLYTMRKDTRAAMQPAPAPTPEPTPEPVLPRKAPDMILVKQAGTDRIWLLTGTSRRFVADYESFAQLRAAGVPFNPDVQVSSTFLQWFPQSADAALAEISSTRTPVVVDPT